MHRERLQTEAPWLLTHVMRRWIPVLVQRLKIAKDVSRTVVHDAKGIRSWHES